MEDPLYRFFERETVFGGRLLADVRQDLEDVVAICGGTKKQSNHHRQLTAALNRGMVPEGWNRYKVPAGVTVMAWVEDLGSRIKQLSGVVEAVKKEQAKGLKSLRVWLGGLFAPEAYITATRQLVAQANEWSLEELQLELSAAESFDSLKPDDCSFPIFGLKLMGASCVSGNALTLSDHIFTDMTAVLLHWRRKDARPAKAHPNSVSLPVYRYPSRAELLFTLDFSVPDSNVAAAVYQRGVALIAANHLG